MIKICLNGEDFECETQVTINQLLDKLGLDKRTIAIERNLEIVPKSMWDEILLFADDRIELVQFVGGG